MLLGAVYAFRQSTFSQLLLQADKHLLLEASDQNAQFSAPQQLRWAIIGSSTAIAAAYEGNCKQKLAKCAMPFALTQKASIPVIRPVLNFSAANEVTLSIRETGGKFGHFC